MDSLCSYNAAGGLAAAELELEQRTLFRGFLHGSNKQHGWIEPEQPRMCTDCWTVVCRLQRCGKVRDQFLHMVLLGMFDKAGGYKLAYKYFDEFEARWKHHPPEQLLHAASISLYPPALEAIQRWCGITYPELAYALWTPRTQGRYACCARALDTLD